MKLKRRLRTKFLKITQIFFIKIQFTSLNPCGFCIFTLDRIIKLQVFCLILHSLTGGHMLEHLENNRLDLLPKKCNLIHNVKCQNPLKRTMEHYKCSSLAFSNKLCDNNHVNFDCP